MQIYYLLSFDFEGIEPQHHAEIGYSLFSGLAKGAVTDKFHYHLPYTVSFISSLGPEQIAAILDRINHELFPADRLMRYCLAEVNHHTLQANPNTAQKERFEEEMAKR